ncbi:MAG: 4-alpha-glucanotransferase [Ruminococcaceae bacterium]|nr:4-alpha-glucanotransferase [Oscillospiraceae bacterium]
MNLPRSSGVLMHVTSLPGSQSIGCFGKEAYEFIDFLADCGFTWWQVLPFCMADECNSPYKSYSAFGGNPYFVDLRALQKVGLLTADELTAVKEDQPYACEYEKLAETRMDLLRLAADRVSPFEREKVEAYIEKHQELSQFCDFMALRRANGGTPWYEWTVAEPDNNERFAWAFIQYTFMAQWSAVRAYANKRGIKIMGDMPIYVAYDSCDVWANRDLFQLDKDGCPTAVAGCPPDYFSEDGQLWGNPLYDWKRMETDNFAWWSTRMAHMLTLFDGVRIDHFRGLESYWSIPADAESAKEGHWVKGPGKPFIKRMYEVAAEMEAVTGQPAVIVAEDLGEATPALEKFVKESGFPNMHVIQFAFDGNPQNTHLPHNYLANSVAYTGTHDNNTLLGFIWELDDDSRRKVLAYCGYTSENWDTPDAYRAVMRTLFASVANLAILPIQDVLGYGADTRMNIPGCPEGNWRYRVTSAQLDSIDKNYFRKLNSLYGR